MQNIQYTELQELECVYCELHKDVYGVKARWYRAESVEQARKDIDSLQAQGEAVWAEERAAQERAVVNFEKLVASTIANGAADRATALRWIHVAEGTRGDNEELCYAMNIPYNYFK